MAGTTPAMRVESSPPRPFGAPPSRLEAVHVVLEGTNNIRINGDLHDSKIDRALVIAAKSGGEYRDVGRRPEIQEVDRPQHSPSIVMI
jgi:hypothetical protein